MCDLPPLCILMGMRASMYGWVLVSRRGEGSGPAKSPRYMEGQEPGILRLTFETDPGKIWKSWKNSGK